MLLKFIVHAGTNKCIDTALLIGNTLTGLKYTEMSLKASGTHTWHGEGHRVRQGDGAMLSVNGGNRINTGVKMGRGK